MGLKSPLVLFLTARERLPRFSSNYHCMMTQQKVMDGWHLTALGLMF